MHHIPYVYETFWGHSTLADLPAREAWTTQHETEMWMRLLATVQKYARLNVCYLHMFSAAVCPSQYVSVVILYTI